MEEKVGEIRAEIKCRPPSPAHTETAPKIFGLTSEDRREQKSKEEEGFEGGVKEEHRGEKPRTASDKAPHLSHLSHLTHHPTHLSRLRKTSIAQPH